MTDLSTVVATLPEREQILILRSVCHVVPDEDALPEAAKFHNKVTDIDVARLIHAIERGYTVVPEGAVWTDLRGDLRRKMLHLTRIVNECLRLGLVQRASREILPDVWRVWLVAAPVHASAGVNRTLCDASRRMAGRRYRLTDDAGLIDCEACQGMNR